VSAYKYLGKKIPVIDAAQKVTGQTRYTDDLKLSGMLYAKVLFSPHPHARIVAIDTREAEALPGVRAVATYRNTSQVLYNSTTRFLLQDPLILTERIFDQTVRFVGDRVAAVAADSLEIAGKAIRLIKVEYELLPYYLDGEEAVQEGAYPIHPQGNLALEVVQNAGDVDKAFAEADYIFEDRYTTPPVHQAALETHTAIADFGATGKLTVISSTQNTFGQRIVLSKIFQLPMSKVRVIAPPLGGAFGGKIEAIVEPVAAALAILCHKPVKLTYNRKESMISTRTRHGSVTYLKTGVMKDGTIIAQDFKVITNTGAYAASASNVIKAMSNKVFGSYKIPNMRFIGRPVYTNLPIAGAMRGYGSPQAYFAQQCQMQKIAKALNIDPVKVQMKNLIDPDGVDPRNQKPIGNPRPKDCLRRALELKKNWPPLDDENGEYLIGEGLAIGMHGNSAYGAHTDQTSIIIKVHDDGSCILYTGTHEMGQAALTLQKQMVCEVLDLPWEMVDVVAADTDTCPWALGDFSSRGTFIGGYAAKEAAEKVKARILAEAALLMKEDQGQLVLENAAVRSWQSGRSVSLPQVMDHAQNVTHQEIMVTHTYPTPGGPGSYGAHIVRVRVERQSGVAEVTDYIAVQDLGTVVNRFSCEGQVEGAIQMGMGYALYESLNFDERGKCTNSNFRKYKIVNATQMPRIQMDFIEEYEPTGPFGAKSLSECALVPSAPAIINAVSNAIHQEIHDLPYRPAGGR